MTTKRAADTAAEWRIYMGVSEYFGCNVFNEEIMRDRLPKDVFKTLTMTINDNKPLDESVANVVANAMKDWAIEKGATHFTHWFQPMTGITAEKHDSFISPAPGGKIIMEFSGKELIKGEPDASSFPSGGLRATFEARGYTSWDPTSYAFVKDGTLFIPTAFSSYTGEVLDKKTPLLRSMEVLSKETVKLLNLMGHSDVTSVHTTVGPEQEYFLIDKKYFDMREDLQLSGRTLFGAMPPKGQEKDDHYFGSLKERVSSYMKELDEELWKLGIPSKTKHNEVAPAQHELAPVFESTNIATDHNQLIMDCMKKIALRHGLVCLLGEKPFAGVNGSGKHNNWSISTNTGINLLSPGKKPAENTLFLTFLAAMIEGVDEYGDLMRVSVASAGNDHRLGAHEAPPAVVSMFIGDELEAIIDAIDAGVDYKAPTSVNYDAGVDILPTFRKDTTDRNRTSPFAFTGNKFEFRMPGSSQSIAGINVVLNTIAAEIISRYSAALEKSSDREKTLKELIKNSIHNHKRIVFNGNGYDEAWLTEASRRGLPNLASTVDALPAYIAEKNIDLFVKHGIYTRHEILARFDVKSEGYYKNINIEARVMSDMVRKDYIPAVAAYLNDLCSSVSAQKACGAAPRHMQKTAEEVSALTDDLYDVADRLDAALAGASGGSSYDLCRYYYDNVIPIMTEMRGIVDKLELKVGRSYWPVPAYSDMLFKV